MSTDTMYEFMGVRVDPVDDPISTDLRKVTEPLRPSGKVGKSSAGYSFDGRLNDSFRAMNLLIDKGVAVRRVDKGVEGLRPGDFVITSAPEPVVSSIAPRDRAITAAIWTKAGRASSWSSSVFRTHR
jgi:hypothetical protein